MLSVTSGSSIDLVNDAIYAAVQTTGVVDLWIDSLNGAWETADGRAGGSGTPWFFGTGKVGATTGLGNSDIACAAGDIHPTGAGDDIYYSHLASVFDQAFTPYARVAPSGVLPAAPDVDPVR